MRVLGWKVLVCELGMYIGVRWCVDVVDTD